MPEGGLALKYVESQRAFWGKLKLRRYYLVADDYCLAEPTQLRS